uniref:HNH endonuclease n=1 Tax=Candidatus Kentrum sp. DK TaxID=2126562 RepID=A0A450S8R0_9GAMM|nr:MAG: HNH endonuclease [Candidatus Kentron sp. DK]
MKRKAIPQKIRMTLQKEIDSSCPFCGIDCVEHFQFHHIDENPENNDPKNLIMVCPTCHSKITKGDISHSEAEDKKKELASKTPLVKNGAMGQIINSGQIININAEAGNAVVGDNNKVTVNIKNPTKAKYPEGSLGANNDKANYIGYLITRYHEYKEWEVGKKKMNYAIFQSQLKKKYKIGKNRTIYNIPEGRFEELAEYIQDRIDGTVLASVKRSKKQFKNYLSFEEYVQETNN